MISNGFTRTERPDLLTPTCTDVSHALPGGSVSVLTPTAQAGGNQVSDLSHAMTAPGSQPSTPFTSVPGEIIDHPAPVIEALKTGRGVVIGPDGSKSAVQ